MNIETMKHKFLLIGFYCVDKYLMLIDIQVINYGVNHIVID
jgi:hypothetical protein